jgi:hypothetical protein
VYQDTATQHGHSQYNVNITRIAAKTRSYIKNTIGNREVKELSEEYIEQSLVIIFAIGNNDNRHNNPGRIC